MKWNSYQLLLKPLGIDRKLEEIRYVLDLRSQGIEMNSVHFDPKIQELKGILYILPLRSRELKGILYTLTLRFQGIEGNSVHSLWKLDQFGTFWRKFYAIWT